MAGDAANSGLAVALVEELAGVRDELKRLGEHLHSVHRLAADRSQEIERLREGHDFAVARSFARGVIKVADLALDFRRQLEAMHGEQDSPLLRDALQRFAALEDQLAFLLEGQQVERFEPSPGDSLKEHAARIEAIDSRPAAASEQVGCVHEVRYPGYRLVLADGAERVVREALVSVFAADDQERSR